MTRYWFEFDFDDYNDQIPFGLIIGCGITAFDDSDALIILKTKIFKDQELPKINKMLKNVDINTLDQNHVIPNMAPVIYRGVWFPQGFI